MTVLSGMEATDSALFSHSNHCQQFLACSGEPRSRHSRERGNPVRKTSSELLDSFLQAKDGKDYPVSFAFGGAHHLTKL